MSYKIPKSCYSEYETAKDIVCFAYDKRAEIRRNYRDKHYSEYLQLIAKYCINQNLSNDETLIFLRKHTALVLYFSEIFYNFNKKEKNEYISKWRIPEFDYLLLEQTVDFNSLISLDLSKYDDNPFATFYNSNDYNDIKKCKKDILDNLVLEAGTKLKLGYLFKCFFDYFYYTCSFKNNQIGIYGHNDLFLSLCLMNPTLRSFTFGINSDFSRNLVNKNPNELDKKVNSCLLGYIIDIIFTNDNLNFDKEMKVRPDYYYNILLCRDRGKTIRELFKFFVYIDEKKTIIEKDKISSEFSFIYNGENYIFTKKGIIKSN